MELKEEGRAEGRTEGRAEGRTEGRAEGWTEDRAEGRTEERADIIARMKASGMTDEQIGKLLSINV